MKAYYSFLVLLIFLFSTTLINAQKKQVYKKNHKTTVSSKTSNISKQAVPDYEICTLCQGKKFEICNKCKGQREIYCDLHNGYDNCDEYDDEYSDCDKICTRCGGLEREFTTCYYCFGSGLENKTCNKCHGKGKTLSKK